MVTAPTTTTSAPPSASSSRATASNAVPSASAPAESASSGVLTGQLTPSFDVADLPLVGPGSWEVASSGPVAVSLECPGAAITVQLQFVIGAHEQCEVSISAKSPTSTVTWQLTPTR
ncbi:MAG: hypothetical protein WCA31_04475 [Acidimicrobiales bacterium]